LVPAVVVYSVTAVIGVGYAGQQVFGLAMLPDCIAYDAARTGRRQAGVFTGVLTAGETLGLALGPGVYAVVLSVFGYVSSTSGTVARSDTARRPTSPRREWSCRHRRIRRSPRSGAYLQVALDVVPIDPTTLRVSPDAIAAAIGPQTVLVVASAPAYPHGVVDPVPAIAAAALDRGVRAMSTHASAGGSCRSGETSEWPASRSTSRCPV
jgi:hypothetical protein